MTIDRECGDRGWPRGLKLMNLLRRLVTEITGQDLIEYAMLAGILALGTVVMTTNLGGAIINTFWQRIARMLASLPSA
jgi:Flp pilus assembly pilin Flp